MNQVPSVWFEDADGRRWVPGDDSDRCPPGFTVVHRRDPLVLQHEMYDRLAPEDLDAGDGVTVELAWDEELVSAMHRPNALERLRQLARHGRLAPTLPLEQAILVSAVACDACSEALAHEHGCSWGERRGSRRHQAHGTTCELCKPPRVVGKEAGH